MLPKKGTIEYVEWIKTPNYIEFCERKQIIAQNPKWRSKNMEFAQLRSQNPEWIRKNKEWREKMYQDPEWRRNQKETLAKRNKEMARNPEWRRKNKESAQRRAKDPEWRRKNKEFMQQLTVNPEYKFKYKIRSQNPEWQLMMQNRNKEMAQNSEYKENLIGGFWYGNVRYLTRTVYCELWNKDLWKRIDAFWDYKSSLSGLTKEDNKDKNGKVKALSRHHVYWQPKACCEWDEDKQGYYAWINIGTNWKPNWYKHYVNGDPNKFVLLTSKEHGMVSKDKLKWIKIFEDIIEQRDGKSYYTKEEMEKLNIL